MPVPVNPEPMNTAGLLANAIDQAGVSSIFGYPGDPTIELMEQARRRDIDVVLARREGTAALMAEGYAMATGNLGVAFSTLGPGSSALVSGVASAQLDRVAVLAISGQIDSAQEQYITHQVIDHGLLFAPVSKWAGRLEARSAGIILRKALRLATAERPGAVHLTANADTLTKDPSTATRIEDMDLVDLASGLACDGVRVTSPGELTKALADVAGLTRPLIVEARIDPSQYLSQF